MITPIESAFPPGGRPEGEVKSAYRTVDVLEVLAAAEYPMTLSEIHRELGYPKSSLHGILRTLLGRGWVTTDERGTTYGIGLRALRIGAAFLDRDPVVQAANGVLARLREELDETCHLARIDGSDVVYLASRESKHHLRTSSRIGRRQPAHTTSLGKAILAHRPIDEVLLELPKTLVALTPNTVTDHAALRTELEQTALRGWAHERGENTLGIECYSVTVPARHVVDAISCSLPANRVNPELSSTIINALTTAAQEIAVLAGSRR